jgi:putative ABC transport system permease protein
MLAAWTFRTLIGHWRRHPLNFATLLIGLAIATALWSGVQALNRQARASYDRAASVLGPHGSTVLVPARGAFVAQDVFVTLRRAGWKVSPVLEGTVRISGAAYRLVGIEPLTLPAGSRLADVRSGVSLERFLVPPGQTLVARETLADLGDVDGARPVTDRGHALPPLARLDDMALGLLVVDIGVAQDILDRPRQLSRLVGGAPDRDAAALTALTGGALKLEAPGEESDLARLTDSFHLNLTAFGFLAFIVGLFIVHASIGLAFEQRLAMLRTMRAVGVPLRTLMAALIAEVLLLALLAGAAGIVGGYLIAAALLPDVAASLSGLYGAHVGGRLALETGWWVSGLGMAIAGALAASGLGLVKVYALPMLAVAKPLAWREAQQHQLRRQGALAAAFLALAAGAYSVAHGLLAGFTIIAGLLLGVALLLPVALAALLRTGEAWSKGAVARWFWADCRQQLSGLSLALMALLLALSANVGVGTMVEGFRKTFTSWLDERLNSEVYFDAAVAADADRIVAWLDARPDVAAVLPVWRAETRIGGLPADVIGTRDHATYRRNFSLLSRLDDVWDRVRDGEGVLVSEQLARRIGLGVGDVIALPTADGVWEVKIAGVYPDYGNPRGQVRVDVGQLTKRWPNAARTSFSVRTAPEAAGPLIEAMQANFGTALARVVDQATLKAQSKRIFERTFAVTGALNTLTLIVSGIALFASLLTLSDVRLTQLAPVWALGVNRRRLAVLEIVKILVLAAVTAVLAVPLGLVLAWCLVAIVNVEAFGWRLPFHVFPEQWSIVLLMAVLTALLAAVVPVLRLRRTAPGELLKVFANER